MASYPGQTTLPPSSEATVLAPVPPSSSVPPRRRGLLGLLIAAAVLLVLGTMLAAGMVLVAVWWWHGSPTRDNQTNVTDKANETPKAKSPENPKEHPQPDGPITLIDEDFQTTAKKGLPLPDGWIGDGFRVVTVKERAALEVSKQGGGAEVVKVPLRRPVKGNFSITGSYALVNYYKALVVLLEDSKSGAGLSVVFQGNGGVLILKDSYQPLPGFALYQPSQFSIQRTGNKLTVAIDGKIVAAKDFKDAPEYDTLSLSLTAGDTTLFRLKRLSIWGPSANGENSGPLLAAGGGEVYLLIWRTMSHNF